MKETEISTSWHSYPSIFAVGHRAIRDIFNSNVVVEEKVELFARFEQPGWDTIGFGVGSDLRDL